MNPILFVFVLSTVDFVCSDFAGLKTSEKFERSVSLDKGENYILFWNYNESHVTFEVHVRTKGWVGFGISGNGNMYPSDVVVGWVLDDGTVHFSDRHTVGHQIPLVDKSQDWTLLFGEENEFGTVLKFVRKINTCDDSEDMVIQDGTTRLIYAFGKDDPADENSLQYHGTSRGTKSVPLLSPSTTGGNLPDDTKHIDFLNGNYFVPNRTTAYHCRGFKFPAIGKHHMIKYEVILTPGNEQNVHHMLLYRCNVNDPDKWDGVSDDCYWNFGKRILPQCYNAIIAWAIGGEPYYFPDNVGFSMGGPEDEVFYVLETHYDNPNRKTNMIDNSGLRMTVTPTLRPNEAGMLTVGAAVDESQVVPPGLNNFVSKTYCHEDCLNEGDSFRVDCIYDSTGRNITTFGGFSTQDEMCLSFVYYYPHMKLQFCESRPLLDNFPFDNKNLRHSIESLDWSSEMDYFLANIDNGTVSETCFGIHLKPTWPARTFTPSEPAHIYTPPPPDCS